MSFFIVLCACVLQDKVCTAQKSSVFAVVYMFCMLHSLKRSGSLCYLVKVDV